MAARKSTPKAPEGASEVLARALADWPRVAVLQIDADGTLRVEMYDHDPRRPREERAPAIGFEVSASTDEDY